LSAFEAKYKNEFIAFTQEYNTINLYAKFKELPVDVQNNDALRKAMRHYDYTVNITWVMAHYRAANQYLSKGKDTGEEIEATGGSDWKKYMHPKYQRRIFFPELWSEQELKDWGENV
jgi:tryptophan 2,3-dioxygenase